MEYVRTLKDSIQPIDIMTPHDQVKLARGVLFRDDGKDSYGKQIFTRVAENTVVLSGAIAALERLAGVEASFKPNSLNKTLNINDGVAPYDIYNTPIALFGCGIGGAGLDYGNVYSPDVKQNNVLQLVPMRVSQGELSGIDAEKYMMRTTVSTPNQTSLNCWYLKEFDMAPNIRSLWKDAAETDEDGTEITADVSASESTNGVEAFASFKLVLNDDDIRSYFEAQGMVDMARYNSVGLFLGQKVELSSGREDYVNVSLFSVVNINNEPLAERKNVTYYYRIYAMV